jgi:LmbE family N-acetylglucosaminyl deacetylase
MTPTTSQPSDDTLLVISAHAGDFVGRAGGAIALAAEGGQRAKVLCLSFGERGESARARRAGLGLDETKEPAQAVGYDAPGEPLGAPPLFFFEPHQPEQCDFEPNVLLDITAVFDTDLAERRGVRLKRNARPSLGLSHGTIGEAYVRLHPEATGVPA